MTKGLEALKRYKDSYIEIGFGFKAQEKFGETPEYKQIEKELKAIEIIRREPSMVCWQASYEDYEEYIDGEPELRRYIKNKEEFDLLKEVLL